MSGGAYGYLAAKLDAAASDIEQTIRENTRCQPSWRPETLERLREGAACLRRAAVYEYRIDRLLCHDDDEECFHKWLPRGLAQLEAETPADLALLVAEVQRLREAIARHRDAAGWKASGKSDVDLWTVLDA